MKGGASWIGGVIYIQNLINSIGFLPKEERPDLTLFVWDNTPTEFYDMIDKDLFKLVITSTNLHYRIYRFLYEKLFGPRYNHLIRTFERNGIEVIYPYHSPKKNLHLKCVDWIPDFQHKYLPEMFSQEEIIRRDREHLILAKSADVVVLSSKDAKKDFDLFYPDQKLKSVVMSFVSNIPDDIFNNNLLSIKAKYNLPDKFLLVANQFWKHKDHLTLFRAIHELKKKGLEPLPSLFYSFQIVIPNILMLLPY